MSVAKKLVNLWGAGIRYLVNGSWDSAITSAPRSGLFLSVDNLNFSGFGTTTDIALYDDADDSIEYGFNIDASGVVDIVEDGSVVATTVTTLSTGVNYDIAIALQADKTAHYFIYDASQSAWERVWVGSFVTSATLIYANDATTGATYTTTKEAFGTGMVTETPAIDIALPQVGDGSVSGGDPALPDGDFVMEFTLDMLQTLGALQISFRYQDASNLWDLRWGAGTALKLTETVSGSETIRETTGSGTLVGGEVIRLIADGNTISLYYDNTLAWTYSSADTFLRESDWEVNSLGTGGIISDLKVWKRYARSESDLGAELVTNGDFSAWTGDDPDGWMVTEVPPNSEISEDANGALFYRTSDSLLISQIILTSGNVYRVDIDIYSHVTGSLQVGNISANRVIFTPSVGINTLYFIADGTSFVISRNGNVEMVISSVSVKEVLFSPDALGNKLNEVVS